MTKTIYFLEKDSWGQSPRVVLLIRFPKIFKKISGKHMCQSFFDKVLGWRLETLLTKETSTQMFFFLKTLQNFLWQPRCKQSWTKHCRQILEIKQKQVFLWNAFEVIFYNFLAQLSKFSFRVASWTLLFNSKHFRDFPEISQFPKILRQLVGQLGLSICGDNNLVPFQLWLREPLPKSL